MYHILPFLGANVLLLRDGAVLQVLDFFIIQVQSEVSVFWSTKNQGYARDRILILGPDRWTNEPDRIVPNHFSLHRAGPDQGIWRPPGPVRFLIRFGANF